MFGTAQMFVYDGLVHRHFDVELVADFPYLQKMAPTHQVLLLFSLIIEYGTSAERTKSSVYEMNPVDIP